MKRITFLLVLFLAAVNTMCAQKWDELSKEQQLAKLESFRKDNQNYLKTTLKMTDTQLSDIDNVNICYLSSLDRVDRYGKTDADKKKYAKSLTSARSAQLDGIMGAENRKKYVAFISEKLEKANL